MSDPRPKRPKCVICRTEIDLRPQNPSFPFCSPRCRQIDLGKWLNEEYSLPIEGEDATERSLPREDDFEG